MVRSLIIGCALLVASTARADVELKNDGFVSGGQATFQTGFVVGEAGAVRFVAPSAGRQLRKLQLLFGGATTTQTVTIKVFDDSAGQDAPGAELFMSDFTLMGADNAMQELDLTSANVYVPQQFRVALYFQHAGAPTIASDADSSIAADRNFIYAGTWKRSSALGLSGDWVIRAFVSDVGPAPDAGPGGTFCDTNAECGNRRYCDVDHHACVFDCQDDTECPGGGQCNNLGQCEGGGGDDGGCQTTNGTLGGLLLTMAGVLIVLRRRRA
ncbi:MAG: hypothetical protein JNL83_32980 [Myxococcales bacterium]|nr:hypothetical protein [Myxococcales bacterium]